MSAASLFARFTLAASLLSKALASATATFPWAIAISCFAMSPSLLCAVILIRVPSGALVAALTAKFAVTRFSGLKNNCWNAAPCPYCLLNSSSPSLFFTSSTCLTAPSMFRIVSANSPASLLM